MALTQGHVSLHASRMLKLYRGRDTAESGRRMSRVQRVRKLEYEQRSLRSFNYHCVVLEPCPKPWGSRFPMNINFLGRYLTVLLALTYSLYLPFCLGSRKSCCDFAVHTEKGRNIEADL